MLYVRGKDRAPKNGFNFYPLSDKYYFGVRFRFFNNMFFLHYLKKEKRVVYSRFNSKESIL